MRTPTPRVRSDSAEAILLCLAVAESEIDVYDAARWLGLESNRETGCCGFFEVQERVAARMSELARTIRQKLHGG
jgi:hypothetical protein